MPDFIKTFRLNMSEKRLLCFKPILNDVNDLLDAGITGLQKRRVFRDEFISGEKDKFYYYPVTSNRK